MTKLTVQDLAMFLNGNAEVIEVSQLYLDEPHENDYVPQCSVYITLDLLKDTEQGYVKVKPILRPLSDMTEEEMKELYFIVFRRNFVGNNISHRDIGKELDRYVLWSGLERLFIYANGDIGADCDLSYYPVNQPIVFKWMLSKQFDVFNWIPKGLALDKTKINQTLIN
jgi:hypothetical protein